MQNVHPGRRLKSVRDAKIDSGRADERNLARQREEAGGWIRWLEEHVDFKRMHAHRFITVFEEFGSDVSPGIHTLTLKALYEITKLPPDNDRADLVSKPHSVLSTSASEKVIYLCYYLGINNCDSWSRRAYD